MEQTYHDRLIHRFTETIDDYIFHLGFQPEQIMTNVYCTGGEIDIIIDGEDGERALIEVKEHAGNMTKFLQKQFFTYRSFDKTADIYLLLGNKEQGLEKQDLFLKQYWPPSHH